eukprot:GILK01007000.1.p1 GENE.GILK01007000.1~~GILK01007000.1.p1  ORF type:complete len:171 (-),score=23.08 GILK01007000.1:117-629(-)
MAVVTVRPALLSDVEQLISFNCGIAKETENKDLAPDVIRRGVLGVFENEARGRYYVAEIDGVVAGCLMITYEWSDWRAGNFWWIQSVYCDPAYRRRGAFKALYQHVHDAAKNDKNVCGLRLYVDRENEKAQQTYSALGMVKAHYDIYEVDFVFGEVNAQRQLENHTSTTH